MADFTIKTDDTGPPLAVVCTYSDGTLVDFTGATLLKFSMRNAVGTVIINDATATAVAPLTSGVLQYAWTAPDTATSGFFTGEFHATLASGKRLSFPNRDYIRIEIYKDVP